MTNYVDAVSKRLAELIPGCGHELVRLYTLVALVKGVHATERDVHDAWAIWCVDHRPGHASLVPFEHLPPEEQIHNSKYARAIREVAR